MGGSVAIAVRQEGKVVCRDAHTRLIRPLVQNGSFLAGTQTVSLWEDLDVVDFAPSGYGLVVIDRDTKWVGSLQGYTNPDRFMLPSLAWSSRTAPTEPFGDAALFTAAWRAGAIPGLVSNDGYQDHRVTWEDLAQRLNWGRGCEDLWRWLTKNTSASLFEAFNGKSAGSVFLEGFAYEPPEWVIQDFDENLAGHLAFATALLERGFQEVENRFPLWDDYVASRVEKEGVAQPIAGLLAARRARELTDDLPASAVSSLPRPRV